jgi:peptidoglycan/xylan/chitin deacetylase (PgdA/CDA1 family)
MSRRTSSIRIVATGLFLALLSGRPIFAYESAICKWRGDARGAYTMTFDDGAIGQEEFAVPLLDERGLKGTFFVIGMSVQAWYTVPTRLHARELVEMARNGHEIGSHTHSHRDLRLLTDSEIRQEMQQVQEYLGRYGLWPVSLAYPFGGRDQRVQAIVGEYVEFARGGYPMVTNSSNWTNIDPLNLRWSDSSDHYSCLSAAAERNEWAIGVFHEIGYQGPTVTEFEQFVDAVVALRDSNELWVDTLRNVATYAREMAFAKLESKTTNNGKTIEVTLKVASECRAPLVPLTVKTDISGKRLKLIHQVEHPITFTLHEAGTSRFVVYDVLPDAGPVCLELTGTDGG